MREQSPGFMLKPLLFWSQGWFLIIHCYDHLLLIVTILRLGKALSNQPQQVYKNEPDVKARPGLGVGPREGQSRKCRMQSSGLKKHGGFRVWDRGLGISPPAWSPGTRATPFLCGPWRDRPFSQLPETTCSPPQHSGCSISGPVWSF